ncbi:type VI secretion system baseplate subunit TssF [Paraburkholderia sp.]|uniref:type VI secretion system baseplate subunit TssF n=1 Tax=Paraburkholderia sp. TaxID=1926495 RepID=UPI0039C8EDF2
MDPELPGRYAEELRYHIESYKLRFAQPHPKIAARLRSQAGEVGDPYVERLPVRREASWQANDACAARGPGAS